jgi:diaminopimelate decarboxylase
MDAVSSRVKQICADLGADLPFIIIEPGRAISAAAGVTLYTVGTVKEIPNIRTYVSVDGGLTDNPRYSLYKAKYDFVVADRAAKPRTRTVTIAGRCCETDLLGEGVPLQPAAAGDTVAVLATGAYNYSMASNYNRYPKPPVVMICDGKPRVVVKRETLDDLLRNDL